MAKMGLTTKPRSDQTNADDFLTGPRSIKVRDVRVFQDGDEWKADVFYEGDKNKPFKPCMTMRRVIVDIWGDDEAKYIGQSMTLYRDATVDFGKEKGIGGIRISHMTGITVPRKVSVTKSRGKKMMITILPLILDDSTPVDPDVIVEALAAAKTGMDDLKAWFEGTSKENRKMLAGDQIEWGKIKSAAVQADQDIEAMKEKAAAPDPEQTDDDPNTSSIDVDQIQAELDAERQGYDQQ